MAYVIKMGNITINGLIERLNRLNSKPLYCMIPKMPTLIQIFFLKYVILYSCFIASSISVRWFIGALDCSECMFRPFQFDLMYDCTSLLLNVTHLFSMKVMF